MKILVIIPAYNEQENIVQVTRSIEKCKAMCDYLVINDCSVDRSEELLKEHKINHLVLPVNLGIGGAVQAGYLYARDNNYDVAIQVDGDGQHDPAYIGNLIQGIQDGADFVIGSRFINKGGFQSTVFRRAGIAFLSFLIQIVCHQKICDVTSGFRAVNKKGIQLFASNYAQDYPEPEAIIVAKRNHLIISETPVEMYARTGGQSSISGFRTLYYMIKVSLAIIVSGISSRKRRINE